MLTPVVIWPLLSPVPWYLHIVTDLPDLWASDVFLEVPSQTLLFSP